MRVWPAQRWLPIVTGIVAAGAIGSAVAFAAVRADDPVEIRIRLSTFAPAEIHAQPGLPIEIVVRNDDPIDHEWIVGDEGLHERHRAGTEPVHDARPTEVTVPAGEVRRTTVTFAEPGTYRFICHLPGHEAYGMVGTLIVEP
jgi:uncharacterized cupredoxin-like copper-binding protein